ncbi:hypothetical protein GCM10025734_73350 [Kitasatospora paranensis]
MRGSGVEAAGGDTRLDEPEDLPLDEVAHPADLGEVLGAERGQLVVHDPGAGVRAGVVEGEVVDQPAQRRGRVVGGRDRLLHQSHGALVARPRDHVEEVLLGLVVHVERRRAHPGRGGDVARCRAVEALLGEHADGRLEQPGPGRVGAGSEGIGHRASILPDSGRAAIPGAPL